MATVDGHLSASLATAVTSWSADLSGIADGSWMIIVQHLSASATWTPPAGWSKLNAGAYVTIGTRVYSVYAKIKAGDTTVGVSDLSAARTGQVLVLYGSGISSVAGWTIGSFWGRGATATAVNTAPSVTAASSGLALAFSLEATNTIEAEPTFTAGWTDSAWLPQTGTAPIETILALSKTVNAGDVTGDVTVTYANSLANNGGGFQIALPAVVAVPAIVVSRLEATVTEAPLTPAAIVVSRLEATVAAAGSGPVGIVVSRLEATVPSTITFTVDDQTADSGQTVTVQAHAPAGVTPSQWEWTQIAGPTVNLNGSGGSRTVVAPALLSDATLSYRVRALFGSAWSDPVTVDIQVAKNKWWVKKASGLTAATRYSPLNPILPPTGGGGGVDPTPGPTTAGLFFQMPSNIHDTTRKAFAHYFGPYPRSMDNANTEATDYYSRVFNNPYATNSDSYGVWKDFGGYFRNRPIFRAHSSSPTWQVDDCKWDIQQAYAAGIDGFFCDLLGLSGSNYDTYEHLKTALRQLRAQDATYNKFYVMAMIDANGATATQTSTVAGNYVKSFSDTSYYLPDGRMLWSCFKAEGKPESWWQGVADYLTGQGLPNVFIGVYNNYNLATGYTGVSYGDGQWGFAGDPSVISHSSNQAATSHGRGKVYMQPIEAQDIRPRNQLFDEACNTESLRTSWNKAITQAADYVQFKTWSDYSENTEVAPSTASGWVHLDISSYYMAKWKTGTFPTIAADALYLSYRDNFSNSTPTGPQTEQMQHWSRGSMSAVRDTVEVLSYLIAPADVTVTIGGVDHTYTAPAGEHAQLFPLVAGDPPSATAVRSDATVASVTGTRQVQVAPLMDDKQYFRYSSLRGTAGQERHPGPNPPYA